MFDISPLLFGIIIVAGFLTAIMGGIAGIGTAIAMIPIMAFAVGVRDAVPIVTVAMMFNNGGRVWANRHYIDYRVVLWFSLGAIPMSVLGASVFANAPADILARALGVFLILLVIYRHLPFAEGLEIRQVKKFTIVGSIQGFMSSIFGGAGPFGAHFFMSYGLFRNAFVGTAALSTTSINLTKGGTYVGWSLLDANAIGLGLTVGVVMIGGGYVGGALVKRMPDRSFVFIVEGVMLAAAAALLIRG